MTRTRHSRLGVFCRVLALWVVTGLAFLVLTALLPGIAVPSFDGALVTTLLIAVLNRLLWPLLTRLFLPITVLTLGLATLVGNALIIVLAVNIVDGSHPSFGGALAAAFGLAIVTMIAIPVLGIDGDAHHLRLVRRRRRRLREHNTTDVPGVILFEIDGLAEGVLRRALDEGRAPTLARWLGDGSHRIVSWECDLSSQTGASQAGLLLGSNFDMPAFRWYEKERGELVVSNHPRDAAEIERRRSDGAGLLAGGGRVVPHPPGGRGGDRARALRRGGSAGGRRRQPREPGVGRRSALHGHDERRARSQALAVQRVLLLLRRPVRPRSHRLAVPVGRAAGTACGAPAARARRAARGPRGHLPVRPRGHHGRDARPQRRDDAGGRRHGRAGRLRHIRGV